MNFKSKFASTVIALSLTVAANAQSGATLSTASAAAIIIQPITLVQTTGLHFGEIATTGAGGSVTVPSSGAVRTKTGDVSLPAAPATNHSAALFTVTGSSGYVYNITLQPTPITISFGAAQMTVSDFETPVLQKVLVGGTNTFPVGAKIAVDGNQAPGTYTGTYTVTVDYN